MSIPEYINGDTPRFVWINSGVSMSPTIEIRTGSETVVETGTMVDSLNGHYYYQWQTDPNSYSAGYYVGRMKGSAGGKTFVRDAKIRLIGGGVD